MKESPPTAGPARGAKANGSPQKAKAVRWASLAVPFREVYYRASLPTQTRRFHPNQEDAVEPLALQRPTFQKVASTPGRFVITESIRVEAALVGRPSRIRT